MKDALLAAITTGLEKEIRRNSMAENIKCEILETCIEFPETRRYHLELNLVRKWGRQRTEVRFRRRNEDRSKMTKGVTLSKEELPYLIGRAFKY